MPTITSSQDSSQGAPPRNGRGAGAPRVTGSARVGGASARRGRALVRSSRCGLQFDPRTSFEAWSALGARIAGQAKTASWWLGDWVAFGERRYGRRYRLAVQATGLDYQTLRNYAVVARRFELSRRRDTLSLQHHAEVCALPDKLQDRWLDLAVINRWSKQELRRRIRQDANPDTGAGACTLRLTVDPDRQQRWHEAASGCGCSFEDWVIRSLDAAATS